MTSTVESRRFKVKVNYPQQAGGSNVITWGTKVSLTADTLNNPKKGLQAKHGNRYGPKFSPGVQVELDILANKISAKVATGALYNKQRQAALLTEGYFFGLLDGIERLLGNGPWAVPVLGHTHMVNPADEFDIDDIADLDDMDAESTDVPTFYPAIPDIPIELNQLRQHFTANPNDFVPLSRQAWVRSNPPKMRIVPDDFKKPVDISVTPSKWFYLASDYVDSRKAWKGLPKSKVFKTKSGQTRAGFSQYASGIKRDWAWRPPASANGYGASKFISSQFLKNYKELEPGQKRFEGGKFVIALPRMPDPLDAIVRAPFMYKTRPRKGSWETPDLNVRNDSLDWKWRFGNSEYSRPLVGNFAAAAGKVWLQRLRLRMLAPG
jgi:hypothetical protein